MTTDPDPLDAAFNAIRREPVPDRPPDAELLARLTADPAPAGRSTPHFPRRMILRLTKWSLAAAALAVVGSAVLYTGSEAVALAEVLKAAETHKVVKFKSKVILTYTRLANPDPETRRMTVYADLRSARLRQEDSEEVRGPFRLARYTVYDYLNDRRLTAYHNQPVDGVGVGEKGAVLLVHSTERHTSPMTKTTFPEQLRELETHKDSIVFKEDKSIRYTIVDGKTTTTLWVDATTKLPIRMVVEMEQPAVVLERLRIESTDFEWDPELQGFKSADDLFSLSPPEGYPLDDQTKKPPEKR
ncbi:MAG: hypothetical protein ACRC1K_04240 [Planctomycetia bacterium]